MLILACLTVIEGVYEFYSLVLLGLHMLFLTICLWFKSYFHQLSLPGWACHGHRNFRTDQIPMLISSRVFFLRLHTCVSILSKKPLMLQYLNKLMDCQSEGD